MRLDLANKLTWIGRVALTAVISYGLSTLFYRTEYIQFINTRSIAFWPHSSARLRKMGRLWPPFQHPILWILHSIAMLILFSRFCKEEHLIATARRFGFFLQQPSRSLQFLLSFALCFLVTVAEYQLLFPMIRLAEMHPIVLIMDFFYMFAVSLTAKLVLKITDFSWKTKIE